MSEEVRRLARAENIQPVKSSTCASTQVLLVVGRRMITPHLMIPAIRISRTSPPPIACPNLSDSDAVEAARIAKHGFIRLVIRIGPLRAIFKLAKYCDC